MSERGQGGGETVEMCNEKWASPIFIRHWPELIAASYLYQERTERDMSSLAASYLDKILTSPKETAIVNSNFNQPSIGNRF